MSSLPTHDYQHLLAILILVARIGDIGTTFILTPNMKLEANALMRKGKWPFALMSLSLCLVPYISQPAAVMLLVTSLMLSVSNSLRLWLVRSVGEEEYHQFVVAAAGKANPRETLFLVFLPGAFMMLLAITMFLFYPSESEWGYWIAGGFLAYAMILLVHMPAGFARYRREALQGESLVKGQDC
ncbi:MAG: hypothetical protein OEZ68_14500 [Gammaproteobacteria bacterium]|nr:hypothetical protein [Gammaproteobacteria bacterium]MDH5802013.1 hypothetical protein [Gammaproteobacteria bacterium]